MVGWHGSSFWKAKNNSRIPNPPKQHGFDFALGREGGIMNGTRIAF